MTSRLALVALFVVLSLQLAFQPVAEATVSRASLAAVPATEVAAQNEAKPKQQKRAAKKKKQQRAKKAKKAKKAKQGNQRQRQKPKQQRYQRPHNQQQRGQQRPDGVTNVSTPGQSDVPMLAGGRLAGSETRVAQAQNPGKRYIVLFASDRVDSQALTANLDRLPGVIPTNIFEHTVKGFAGFLTPVARQALAQDPRVAAVVKDEQVFLAAQTLPRGIDRVDAELNPVADIDGGGPGVNVDIAIIDSGTDLGHPDLNVFAWADCASDPNSPNHGWDLDGHGTHVAGTVAAIDNTSGVVGVAPGARLWSMRVMDDNGLMFNSYIIDCMDLVAVHANTPFQGQTIDAANMSLGRQYSNDQCNGSDAFNDAVCGMVNAGVTVVVAAGNSAMNAAQFNPANIDAVITVSALADSNGQPGGGGPNYSDACTNPQQDDSLATFSNYGADVDIAAPGVGVLSTFPTYLGHNCAPGAGVGYEIYPGTSMASPHVAGAAGLQLAANPNLTPAQVKAALLACRENVAMPGDPDGINEGILNVGQCGGGGGGGDTSGPSLSVNGPGSAKARQRVTLRVAAADPSGVARVELYLCRPGCRKVAQDAAAPYSFVRRHNSPGRVKYEIRAYDNAGNVSKKVKTINVRPASKRNR